MMGDGRGGRLLAEHETWRAPGVLPALLLALCLAPVGAARAQAVALDASFPASLQQQALIDWVKATTRLAPENVVAVTRTALSAISGSRPGRDGTIHVSVTSEAIDPAMYATEGLLSWEVPVEVDCRTRRARQGATRGHRLRGLEGAARMVLPPMDDWRTPGEGTQLHNVMAAVCDPGFQRPLVPAGAHAIAAQAAKAPAPAGDRLVGAEATAPARAAPASGAAVRGPGMAAASEAEAKSAAAQLAQRFPQLLAGLEVEIVQARVDGRAFHRVLASGFRSPRQAADFCASLKAAGQDCFVRRERP